MVKIEDFLRSSIALSGFLSELGGYLETCDKVKEVKSIYWDDMKETVSKVQIQAGTSLVELAIEYGKDHLVAFLKLTDPRTSVFPCSNCIRSMMEFMAIGCWLLDENADRLTRVSRILETRYQQLHEQLKYLKSVDPNSLDIERIEERKQNLIDTASELGISCRKDKKTQNIVGIGDGKLNATNLIGNMLNEEMGYRLLSGIAHGQSWAQLAIGYRTSANVEGSDGGGDDKTLKVDAIIPPDFLMFLLLRGFLSYARLVHCYCKYRGWDLDSLEKLLDDCASRIGINDGPRFWRKL